MGAVICPRCQEPYAGSVVAGDWLTCRSCQHRWIPTSSKASSRENADLPALPPAPAMSELPPVSPTAKPTKTTLSSQKTIMDSDEYSPNETEYNRAIALTNRHESGDTLDNIPSAKAVTQGVDPFDPGMFDKMAREAKSERIKKTETGRNKQEPPIPARTITCPVCGHGYKSNIPDDASQKCPQCNTSFNLKKGFVSSGLSRSSGDVLIGRELRGCLIDRKVGEGGMGAVYHAQQLSLERSVAIKVLPPELARNRNFITRFEREAKSLAKINHPNILHIYDYGEDPEIGIYFMIMEFVEGRDLGEMLHESYTLGQLEVLDIIRQAALGLEMAANKGVIHRDIKPDNLMLTDEGICKVSDFGLAKANSAEKDVTTIGVRVGTPAFMSPEQCDGDDVDFRSDVYNLGCTAFLALTGQLPYDADTPFAIMLKHKNDPVPSPKTYNPNLDSRVEKLVMQMIAKRPADRCESLRELIEAVEDVVVKLAGTSHVLRKSKGPIRSMSELDQLEHAKLTSSGPRRILPPPQAERVSPAQHDIPAARAASSAAPTGEGAVPDWLKPVENKPRKSSSNIQPTVTPRPAPQAGTTSQPALKDLRTKLAEAKHRNIKEEVEVLRQEAGRLSANGQSEKAAEVYMRAAAITPNPKESQELMAKATWSRRSFGWGKFIRRIFIFLILCAALAAGAFYGIPVGHNILAEQAYAPIQAISAPAARLQATEQFVGTYGKLVPYYEEIFKQKYDINVINQAKNDIEQLKIQLSPPPVIEEKKPSPADLEMKKLEALRDDVSIPWMQVVAEARRIVEQGAAKDRARPILSQAEQQIAAMASDYEAIRKQWAGGHQGEVAKLAAQFREKHTRAGQAAPSALPGQLTIVDNDTQSVPTGIKIVTKALLEANSAHTGVIAGEAVLPTGEFAFCRYPHVPVQIEISAPGYRSERLQIPASAETGVVVVPVTMIPTTVWQTEVGKSPRWMHVNKLPESNNIALVRTPDRYSLINLETGKLSKGISRAQIDVPLPSGTKIAYWTDAWDVNGTQLVTGTTDGIAIGIRVSPQELVLANLMHRGPNPMVAFRSKELTFQAGAYASFVISSSDQGLQIQARTKDKDLWSFTGLSGFKRPHMWFADDRVVVIDDNQIHQFDEADGRVMAQKALPGLRTGPIKQIPQTTLFIIPTVQGAVIYNIQANKITPVADTILSESNGRQIAFNNNNLVAVRGNRDVSLLVWNGNKFEKKWLVSLPEEAKKIAWISCNDNSVIVADEQSAVYILSIMTGETIRQIQHPALLQEAPQIINNKLIVSDRDGHISSYYLPGYNF